MRVGQGVLLACDEPQFPLCTLTAETSLGSDHTPLIFDSGEGVPPKSNRFFFESGWLEVEGFQELMQEYWAILLARVQGRDIVDWWKFMSTGLRQKLKGWNANKGRENREHKQSLVERIKALDEKADAVGISEEEWAFRYHLEEQLLAVFRREEEYWRQRGRVRWSLQGDANTAYFHAVANGRRRKCLINSLITPQGEISDKHLIQKHIYDFYRELLGSEAQRVCGLHPNSWGEHQRVTAEENSLLMRTLTEKE
jgi:mannosylglycoprotein endo-beta-mannosidase